MNKEKRLRVALIWGGRGFENEVSTRGKNHILPILSEKYDVLSTFIDKNGDWFTDYGRVIPAEGGLYCPERGELFAIDCAIPLLHGDWGEDGVVQGALENAKIPYIGCDSPASALCRDKAIVKTVANSIGVPTLPHLLLLREEGVDFALRRAEESLCYPMFIKPCRLGSSVGASSAYDRDELINALKVAFDLCSRVIIEPCLTDKRELECGYYSAMRREIFSYPGEILLSGTYGYREKYVSPAGLSVRAEISTETADAIRDYSRRLVRALGVRDLSRIDYFLSGERIYFNEINTMPGFTDGSLYPRMMEASGVPESELFEGLIRTAQARA